MGQYIPPVGRVVAVYILYMALVAMPGAAEEPNDAERYIAAQRANARAISLVSPVFVTGERFDTDLYLLNLITDPIYVDVSVASSDGHEHHLGRWLLEPSRHEVIALRDHLRGVAETVRDGSVEEWVSLPMISRKTGVPPIWRSSARVPFMPLARIPFPPSSTSMSSLPWSILAPSPLRSWASTSMQAGVFQ